MAGASDEGQTRHVHHKIKPWVVMESPLCQNLLTWQTLTCNDQQKQKQQKKKEWEAGPAGVAGGQVRRQARTNVGGGKEGRSEEKHRRKKYGADLH